MPGGGQVGEGLTLDGRQPADTAEPLPAVGAQPVAAHHRARLFVEDRESVIWRAYRAFNDRDIEAGIALMHADVRWPDATTGEIVHGREDLRRHWHQAFSAMHPVLELNDLRARDDGLIEAEVRQIVRDPDGTVLFDDQVVHVFTIEGGLIRRMEISTT